MLKEGSEGLWRGTEMTGMEGGMGVMTDEGWERKGGEVREMSGQ